MGSYQTPYTKHWYRLIKKENIGRKMYLFYGDERDLNTLENILDFERISYGSKEEETNEMLKETDKISILKGE
jgi:hypothetical protein